MRPINEDDTVTPNAYVLFYTKTTVNEFLRQETEQPESWPHVISNSSSRRASEFSREEETHSSEKTLPNSFCAGEILKIQADSFRKLNTIPC